MLAHARNPPVPIGFHRIEEFEYLKNSSAISGAATLSICPPASNHGPYNVSGKAAPAFWADAALNPFQDLEPVLNFYQKGFRASA